MVQRALAALVLVDCTFEVPPTSALEDEIADLAQDPTRAGIVAPVRTKLDSPSSVARAPISGRHDLQPNPTLVIVEIETLRSRTRMPRAGYVVGRTEGEGGISRPHEGFGGRRKVATEVRPAADAESEAAPTWARMRVVKSSARAPGGITE